ncbi:MAG: ligase-associated DNA damage response endonuclease PdeM [Pseudomonadota bacterium]
MKTLSSSSPSPETVDAVSTSPRDGEASARRVSSASAATGPVMTVNGAALIPDPSGAAYWPARSTLIVADLHFEKGSSYAPRGVFLPPYDTRATPRRLRGAIETYRPQTVISLGDAFHDRGSEARMEREDAALLTALTERSDWIWIAGNHDPAPPARFKGRVCETYADGPLTFRHEPTPGPARGEVAGHLHPCAKVRREGRSLRRRCFATDGARLILPSFGAYTGGLNVRDEAYAGMFGALEAWMIGREAVYRVGEGLVGD